MTQEEWDFTLDNCLLDALSKVFPHGTESGMPAVDAVVQASKDECQGRMAVAERAMLTAAQNPARTAITTQPRGGKL